MLMFMFWISGFTLIAGLLCFILVLSGVDQGTQGAILLLGLKGKHFVFSVLLFLCFSAATCLQFSSLLLFVEGLRPEISGIGSPELSSSEISFTKPPWPLCTDLLPALFPSSEVEGADSSELLPPINFCLHLLV